MCKEKLEELNDYIKELQTITKERKKEERMAFDYEKYPEIR